MSTYRFSYRSKVGRTPSQKLMVSIAGEAIVDLIVKTNVPDDELDARNIWAFIKQQEGFISVSSFDRIETTREPDLIYEP